MLEEEIPYLACCVLEINYILQMAGNYGSRTSPCTVYLLTLSLANEINLRSCCENAGFEGLGLFLLLPLLSVACPPASLSLASLFVPAPAPAHAPAPAPSRSLAHAPAPDPASAPTSVPASVSAPVSAPALVPTPAPVPAPCTPVPPTTPAPAATLASTRVPAPDSCSCSHPWPCSCAYSRCVTTRFRWVSDPPCWPWANPAQDFAMTHELSMSVLLSFPPR